jgi:hypothetical protein
MRCDLRSILVFSFAIAFASEAHADTSAKEFLDKELSSRPAVQRQRTEATTKRVCIPYRIPRSADGGTGYDCHNVSESRVVTFADTPRVVDTSVLEVLNLKFAEDRVVDWP